MFDHDPYDELQRLKPMARFEVTSTDLVDGGSLGALQRGESRGGSDVSPQLSWSGFPPETQSFVVSCFDPDAPTGSGWWHWSVADIPASITSLEADAGAPDAVARGLLPAEAVAYRNEYVESRYRGSGPPPGTGVHRYFFVVHALPVPSLGLDPETTTAAVVSGNCFFRAIGRGILVGTDRHPDD